MRTAARKDLNQRRIVAALWGAGATVSITNQAGLPDLVVGFRNENYLIEVKAAHGKLTQDQVDWFRNWKGAAHVVRSPDEALRIIGVLASD